MDIRLFVVKEKREVDKEEGKNYSDSKTPKTVKRARQ